MGFVESKQMLEKNVFFKKIYIMDLQNFELALLIIFYAFEKFYYFYYFVLPTFSHFSSFVIPC